MEPPPQWRRRATSDWVAHVVERRAAGAEQDRVRVRLERLRLVLVAQVPQHVELVPAQVPEGERGAAARCLAHPTPLAR